MSFGDRLIQAQTIVKEADRRDRQWLIEQFVVAGMFNLWFKECL